MATPVVTDCGGGGPDKTASPDESTDPSELERDAYKLAKDRDFEGAIEHMKAALLKESTPQRRLGVAHLLFMNGNYKQALTGYQAYLSVVEGIPARLDADLSREIDRIDAVVKAGDEPVGRSLAGQWLRGSLASLRAKESLDNGEYANAAVSFDTAYQYTGDIELLFEAALAVTKVEDWPRAREKYIDYLERGRKVVPPEKAYMVRSEIDRLAAIIGGREPVTWNSLADQVYGERVGDRAPMEGPPRIVETAPDSELRGEPEVEEELNGSGYNQVEGGAALGEMSAQSPREIPSLQDLMFYAGSASATVRLRAVKDLISVSDDRARQVLEKRMLNDTNMQVRFTAIRGLSARRSYVSIPVMRKARITAATSQERAVLKKAMDEIVESGW